MGLDQYAYIRTYTPKTKTQKDVHLAQWRKHNRLQGWMEKLWEEKEGDYYTAFNCQEVSIELEDLDRLEKAIKNMELPATEGFFFGNDSYDDYEEWYKKDDLAFIKGARKALKKGAEIVYTSWW